MRKLKRLIKAILVTAFCVVLLLNMLLAYLITTPLGGKVLVYFFKQKFLAVGLMHVGHHQGTLENGFILQDVHIRGLSYLPDALLNIQEVRVYFPLSYPPHYDMYIFNARIFMPDSDPVVFTGEVHSGAIKGELYGRYVDLHELTRFWVGQEVKKSLQGFVSNMDLNIQGTLRDLKISGPFSADNVWYKSIHLTNTSSSMNLEMVWPVLREFQIKGEVLFNAGQINIRKVNLQLISSKLIFTGNPTNPMLNIHMGARAEDADIHIAIKGILSNPQMTVTSDPPMPPEEAMQVLFTGISFSRSPFNSVNSSQLAENFLNYSTQDTNDEPAVGFKTRLTKNLKLGAEMDQKPLPLWATNTYYSRKINGEMDVSNNVSLNVSQQVLTQDSYPSYVQDIQPQSETQVYVQYKKRF